MLVRVHILIKEENRRKQEKNGVVIQHKVVNFEKLKRLCAEINLHLSVVDIDLETWSLKSKLLHSNE